MANTIGKMFSVTSFGSSHGKAVGAVIDGCPANLELNTEDIQKELDKRKPGTSGVTTPRKEEDKVQILSGIFEGKTDGTPITGVVYNNNQHSKDYSMFKNTPRPSHGDYGWMSKYGNYDYNGGGRGSGRITIGHVIAGAIAKKLLKTKNIEIVSQVVQIGDIMAHSNDFDTVKENVEKNSVRCGDLEAAKAMEELILSKKQEGDSIGGIVETVAVGVPAGLGEPVFERLDGDLARILMNINAVKTYLSNDEVKYLETKMLEENSNSVQTEFKERSKGVQKIFKNNSEKYEYLVKNDPNNSWIIEFKNSKEYRLLYE